MRIRLALEELCGLWGAALADRRTPLMAYVHRYLRVPVDAGKSVSAEGLARAVCHMRRPVAMCEKRK